MSEIEKLKQEIERLKKTNLVLMEQVEQNTAEKRGAFSLFENNSLLKKQVSNKTRDLEIALANLKKQQAVAIHQAKLSSLGEMSTGIAHEIKNPLAILTALIRKLQRDEKEKEDTSDEHDNLQMSLIKMEETVQQINMIVDSLRRFGHRQDVPKLVSVQVEKVIEDVMNLCKERLTTEGIRFKCEISDNFKSKRVLGHPIELVQVLVNLLNNSCDAVAGLKDAFIEIKIEKVDHLLNFLVIDNGQGIPADLTQKVMDPFFTTKEVGKGTGIGLNLSKNLMKRMGGELVLKSSGSPTTFLVSVPKQ